VARETYGVAHVVARIYDPGRAEVYERLGIPTVATVSWTAGQIMRQLLPSGAAPEFVDASGTMLLAEVHIGPAWLGRRAIDLEAVVPARLGFLTRYGSAFLPDRDTVLQQGDLVHLLLAPGDRTLVESICEKGPPS
jgi:trk system potassium uptake protein TrkA